MTRKKLLMLLGSVCLALMLAVPFVVACAPAAPEEVAELEAEVAAEKAKTEAAESKVSELESQIAEIRKPAEVYTGIFTCYCPAYMPYVEQLTNEIREMTNGQLDLTVVLEESVGRLEDGLPNLGEGLFECGWIAVEYGAGHYSQYPSLEGGGSLVVDMVCNDIVEVETLLFDYGVADIRSRMLFDKINVTEIIPSVWSTVENLVSNVPLTCCDDLKNVKFRSAGTFATTLEAFGAKTVWFPGGEIYTSLASGLIDAVSYECPTIMYEMGLNEVSKYWTGYPLHRPLGGEPILANTDWWNSLPEHLQACFRLAAENLAHNHLNWCMKQDKITLANCAKEGITVTSWSEEEMRKWRETYVRVNILGHLDEDVMLQEAWSITLRFLEDMGRPFNE